MTSLEAALVDVATYLESERVPYMVIGGYANLHWGRPRLTEDLDVKVQLAEFSWTGFLAGLGSRFRLLAKDPLELLQATQVVPVQTPTGVRVDLIVAGLPYEEEAIRRAIPIEVHGRRIRICAAEDLILHKILSDRPRDGEDVEGVILRQGGALDREYLDAHVRELAAGLERPDLLEFYAECLRKAGLPPPH